jgi:hypothetical protein
VSRRSAGYPNGKYSLAQPHLGGLETRHQIRTPRSLHRCGIECRPGVPVGIGIGMYLANKFDKQHPEPIDKGSYKVHVYHPMNHDCPMEDDWQHMEQKLIARAPGKALNGIFQDYQGNAQLILVEEARSDTGALLFYKPVRIETFREIQRRVDEIQGRVDELIHPAETDRLA